MLDRIDHLVFGAVDLEAGVRHLEALTGVRARSGGAHLGRGTHNALLSLGAHSYLEIIAPDPAQPDPPSPSPLLAGLSASRPLRMTSWAIGDPDLEAIVARSTARGWPARIIPGARTRPDGVAMSWRMGMLEAPEQGGGVTPFFIDWGATESPAKTAPVAGALTRIRVEHPRPQDIQPLYDVLGLEQPIEPGPEPALIATLQTSRGLIELR